MKKIPTFLYSIFISLFSILLSLGAVLILLYFSPSIIGSKEFYKDKFLPDAYSELSKIDVQEIINAHELLARGGHWQFDSSTGLVIRPFQSRLLNVDSLGRRKVIDTDPKYSHLPPLTIWLFGGSTTFGWGLPDSLTMGTLIQEQLQSKFPSRNVRVINFGTPYYDSTAELSKYLHELRLTNEKPDIALFIDGLNDAYLLMKNRHLGEISSTLYTVWEKEVHTFYSTSPIAMLAGYLPQDRAYALPPGPYRGKLDPVKAQNDVGTKISLDNWKYVKAVSEIQGILPIIVIQPRPVWHESADDPEILQWFKVATSQVDHKTIFDLSEIFTAHDSQISLSCKITLGPVKVPQYNCNNVFSPQIDIYTHYSEPTMRALASFVAAISTYKIESEGDRLL